MSLMVAVVASLEHPMAVLVSLWIFAGIAAVLTPQANTFSAVWRIVWPQLMGAI